MLFLLTTFALESRCKITKKNRTDKIIFCQSIKYMKRVALKWKPYVVWGGGYCLLIWSPYGDSRRRREWGPVAPKGLLL